MAFSSSSVISQLQLNNLVLEDFVGALQPLRKVESPDFLNLLKRLQPSKNAPSRKVQALCSTWITMCVFRIVCFVQPVTFGCLVTVGRCGVSIDDVNQPPLPVFESYGSVSAIITSCPSKKLYPSYLSWMHRAVTDIDKWILTLLTAKFQENIRELKRELSDGCCVNNSWLMVSCFRGICGRQHFLAAPPWFV